MKNWFERLISIDELKVSLLSLSLIGILILDTFMAIKYHDVPPQLATITIVIISALAGFNAISVVAGNISANKNGQMPMQNNMYGTSNMYGSSMYGSNPYGNNMGMMNQPMNMNQQITNPSIVQNQTHNLNDPPVQQMPIVQNSGVKSPV